MKKIFSLILIGVWTVSLSGQNIPNPGFENWAVSGDYEIPVGWEASYLGDTGTIYKTPDAHSGQYAVALIMTGDSSGGITWCSRTILTTGTSFFLNPFFSYTGRPAALSGYYKFFPVNGDTLHISFGLMQNNSVMGSGEFFSTAATGNTFQYFEIPATYTLSGNSDMAGISATVDAGSSLCDFIGCVLILDDLAFIDVLTVKESLRDNNFNIHPNPSQSGIFEIQDLRYEVQITKYEEHGKITVTNVLGETILHHSITSSPTKPLQLLYGHLLRKNPIGRGVFGA